MPDTPPQPNDPAVIRRLLTTPATWAVVGLSANTHRTAYSVSSWLRLALGMAVVPVNPRGEGVFDTVGYRSLADIPDGERISVVDIFVRSAHAGAVVDQAIADRDRLGITGVWLQLGVIDVAAAARARAAGLDVVMDTCPRIEAARLDLT